MELVRKYIAENKHVLLDCISDYRNGVQGEDSFERLIRLENDWKKIPLEEKQIPYQDGEKEFWFAYHTIHVILNPKPPINPKGVKLDKEHPAWKTIEKDLKIAEKSLKQNKELPEEIDARRILP